ncbi:MAG: hypothetical protein GF311_19860 [Candidatus Lokiarchaeota archaeon]|nr:hypothetical protein [Candidatus Lokiarchaeota archaeon]
MSRRDPTSSLPWMIPNLENYSHLLLNLSFKLNSDQHYNIEPKSFLLKVFTNGFDGLLLVIYPLADTLILDALINPLGGDHQIQITLPNKSYSLNDEFNMCFLPFGYLRVENNFNFIVELEHFNVIRQLFAWCPSFLYKNIKSIIKVNNAYQEIYPKFNFPMTSFHLEMWFKPNERSLLLNFINLLAELERKEIPDFKLKIMDMKKVISITNEYLFEISEEDFSEDQISIIKELRRLRNNIETLPRSKIISWLNDIIDYYSSQLHQKPV